MLGVKNAKNNKEGKFKLILDTMGNLIFYKDMPYVMEASIDIIDYNIRSKEFFKDRVGNVYDTNAVNFQYIKDTSKIKMKINSQNSEDMSLVLECDSAEIAKKFIGSFKKVLNLRCNSGLF